MTNMGKEMYFVTRELLEKELGRQIMGYLDQGPFRMEDTVEGVCAGALDEICRALKDSALDDFHCIDTIINVLDRLGVSATRHDFG